MLRHESLLDSLSLIQLQHNQTVQQNSVITDYEMEKKKKKQNKKQNKKANNKRG